jgi:hypothetical protein
MKTTFKRMLAAMLAAIMALCVLTGCTKEPAQQTEPQNVGTPLPVGMFVLTAGASVNVRYDIDGLVVEISGNNDSGSALAESYKEYAGKSCADVAKELILAAVKDAHLTAHTKNIVIKQVLGVPLPGTNFMETIEDAVKVAVEEVKTAAVVTLVNTDKMDENGYIDFETAQTLLCNELGVEKLDAYYGLSVPTDGAYICTAEIGGVQTYHSIDAVTGLIADATEEELMDGSDEEIDIEGEMDIDDDSAEPSQENASNDSHAENATESAGEDQADDTAEE